ncbi:MAG: permease [Pseudomonadota bacterium]
MADIPAPSPLPRLWARIDKVWLLVLAIPLVVLVLDPPAAWPTVTDAWAALLRTMPVILFAVGAIGYLKATGSEALVARAFEGREARMIVVAALAGGLSPFCSCQVIPFIAAMLAAGTPLSAVMAFWLSSPLMDPAMFAITADGLGLDFAIAKTVAAVALGILGGAVVMGLMRTGAFADPLRVVEKKGCCGGGKPFQEQPVWDFWRDPARRKTFGEAAGSNLVFLTKWLTLAYLLEVLMIRYIPAEAVVTVVGGEGPLPILIAATVGAPAYLNGYAAVPLLAGLLEQGMSDGAAMAFVIAGAVSSVPAAIAVWALVKPRVFAAYLGLGMLGAFGAGMVWNLIAT